MSDLPQCSPSLSQGIYPRMLRLGGLVAALLLVCSGASYAGESTVVYRLDPGAQRASQWTPSVGMRIEGRRVLGPFGEQAVTFRSDKLPEHEIIRVRLRVELAGQWIDQVAAGGLTIRDGHGRPLFQASFAYPQGADQAIRQSFPDLIRLESRPAGKGSIEAAVKDRPHRLSAIYDLDFSFRHGLQDLALVFEAEGLGSGDYWVIHSLLVEAAKPEPVDDADLLALWELLGTEFDASAHELFSRMIGSGRQLQEFLAGKLRGGIDIERVRTLIGQLDHERFMTREEATNQLIALGVGVIGAVEEAARARPSVEKAERIRFILESISEQETPEAERLRYRRALMLYAMTQSPGDLGWLNQLIAQTNLPHVRGEAERALAIRLAARRTDFFREVDRILVRYEFTAARDRLQERLADSDLPEASQTQINAYLDQLNQIIAARARFEIDSKVSRSEDSEAPSSELQAQWAAFDLGLADQALRVQGLDASSKTHQMIAVLKEINTGRRIEPRALTEWAAWLTERDREPLNDLAGQIRMLRLSELMQTQLRLDALARFEAAEVNGDQAASPPDAELLEGVRVGNRMAHAQRVLGGGWVEILSVLREGAGTFKGRWNINPDGSLSVEPGEFSTYVLPIAVPEAYELRVRFSRVQGEDGIFIRVPVGQGRAGNLNLGGWSNTVSGLEWINEAQANENPTAVRPSGIRNNVNHQLLVQVTPQEGGQSKVVVNLDSKEIISWSGRNQELSEALAWGRAAPESTLVVGAHVSRVVFSSIQVRPLTGELRRLEQPNLGR